MDPAPFPPADAEPTPRRPGASRRESDRRLVRSYRALAQCNRALVRATSEPELLVQLCRVLVQVGEYQLAWVGYAEDDPEKTVRSVAQAGLSDGYVTVRASRRRPEGGRATFARTFRLPADADPDRLEASFAEGTLTIRIDRLEARPRRWITLHGPAEPRSL